MERDITELVLIIDRSGSMAGMESDTIGGINAVLDRNRKLEGECLVTTVLFDDHRKTLHDRIPIEKVPKLTEDDYQVRGCTALLDAVGKTIKHISRVQKYMPEEYKPKHVIFAITTDGLENASRDFTYAEVKRLIKHKQEKGWEFLFLGANIDAEEEAERLGIPEDRAATYECDSDGSVAMYEAVAMASCAMRSAPVEKRVGSSWRESIEKDNNRRKHHHGDRH